MSDPSVAVPCSACQASIEIPQSWLGKRRPCPKCHTWIQMPDGPPGKNTSPTAPATPAAPAAPAIDPFGNTLISHPSLPNASDLQPAAPTALPSADTPIPATPPLTFADRLRHVSGQNPPPRRPTADTPAASPAAPSAPKPPTAANPAAARGTGPRTPVDYGRERPDSPKPPGPAAGAPSRSANPDGRLAGDPDSIAWDDDKAKGWDRENSATDARRGRRGGRGAEAAPAKGGPTLAFIGLGAAIFAIVLCLVTCLGIVMAVSSGGNANSSPGLEMMVGCSVLLIPLVALAGVIFSGIALATGTSRKVMAILGLVINGLFLLGGLAFVCIALAMAP